MTATAYTAAKRHLAELAANGVPKCDRPNALHHGLLTELVREIETLRAQLSPPGQRDAFKTAVEYLSGIRDEAFQCASIDDGSIPDAEDAEHIAYLDELIAKCRAALGVAS
jgi:hypothetical protein